MAPASRIPSAFDACGKKIISKLAAIVQNTGSHGFTYFVGNDGQAQFYASAQFQTIFLEEESRDFFKCPQNPQAVSPDVTLISREQLQRSFEQKIDTFKRMCAAIAEQHPDRSFLAYVCGGPATVAALFCAARPLLNLPNEPEWQQHVMNRFDQVTAGVAGSHQPAAAGRRVRQRVHGPTAAASASAAVATAAASAAVVTVTASATTATASSEAASVIISAAAAAALATADTAVAAAVTAGATAATAATAASMLHGFSWFKVAMCSTPGAACTPLTKSTWALPDYNRKEKLLIKSPVQVRGTCWLCIPLSRDLTRGLSGGGGRWDLLLQLWNVCIADRLRHYKQQSMLSCTIHGYKAKCGVRLLVA
jgi:hypothetical protein